MQTKSVSLAHSPSAHILKVLVVFGLMLLGLAALGVLIFSIWLMTLDQRGTFYITTDLADLDGDGDLDVILHQVRQESETTSFGSSIFWINKGGGRFSPKDLGTEMPPYLYIATVIGDVDGDGDADLFVLSPYFLLLVLNQGGIQGGETGVFKVHNPIKPAGSDGIFGSVVLGDLNNDGQVDGFVAGCCGMGWHDGYSGKQVYLPSMSWVWINEWDSRGWLERHAFHLDELDDLPIRAVALGDLDGDGFLDVFAAVQEPMPDQTSSPADLVLLNDGLGSFRDSELRLGNANSTSVTLGDLDGDGDLDALVGTHHGAMIWINQGGAQRGQTGVFSASEQDFGSGEIRVVFLADLDGDGDLDALIACVRQAVIWWNDGRGIFTQSNQRFRYSHRHGLAVGDFDGDDRPDIFAGLQSRNPRDYLVWINQGDGTFR